MMLNDNYSKISIDSDGIERRSMFDNFIICCSILTIILNIFVLIIASRYVKFNARLEQLFVVNMTVSDLMFGLMFIMTIAKYLFKLPLWYCRSIYVLL